MSLQTEFIKNVVARSGYDYNRGRLHPEYEVLDQNNPTKTINATNELWFLTEIPTEPGISISCQTNLWQSAVPGQDDITREFIMQAFTGQINLDIGQNDAQVFRFVVFTPEGELV